MNFSASKPQLRFLSGNTLKIIAALTMVIDHIGVLFFPGSEAMRIIGRLSFPVFAFMIAQGCKHTKNKPRYFFTVFSLAVLCQIAYYVFEKSLYMGVLVTFSLSIIVIFALQNFKNALFSTNRSCGKVFLASLVLLAAVAAVYFLNQLFFIDYGFWGCMTPVFAALLQPPTRSGSYPKILDCLPLHLLLMGINLIILAYDMGYPQQYALLSIPLLLLYSGSRGKLKMKYFFYIFYPAHLAILQGIYMLVK